MAILHAKNGNAHAAVKLLLRLEADPGEKIACLFVVKKAQKGLEFPEVREQLNLCDEIAKALQVLSSEVEPQVSE